MSVNTNEEFDLDLLIQQIGPFGKYQLLNYLLICIPVTLTAMYSLAFVFTAGDLDYRCRIAECDPDNPNLHATFLNFTTPIDGDRFSMCQKFQHIPNGTVEDQCQVDLFDHNKVEDCSDFVYQDDETTILSEWDLGCSEEWKLSLDGSINNVGQVVGLALSGYISDRFGRRTVFILSCFFAALLGIIRSFSTSYQMFMVFEFLEPALSVGAFNSAFILGMELLCPERRFLGAFFITAFFALGEALLGLLAMVTRDWRLLLQVAYAPTFIFVIYHWIIPESVRWLQSMNRTRDAAKIIESAVKMNKSELTPEAKAMLTQALQKEYYLNKSEKLHEKERDSNEYRLMLVFKSKILLLRILNCCFCWISIGFVYYGLTMNSVSVAGNKYVNYILNCLTEIPGGALSCILMEKIGRRKVLLVSLTLSSVCCIAYIFLQNAPEAAQLVVFLISKCLATMSYIAVYVYTTELFPTELRHTLVSVCGMIGKGKYFESLPMILFACAALPAGILILFAPETHRKTLPDTIQEAEDIGRR
ncbi:organic cation transporter protein-like [Phlebotomus papatasi]|uniref:organic cation transporter protein-like n=1 Tax=Phlebotomus papatasi TaxID=29031 RepID=UPI00248418B4|nr:organic cation transporter protein-like [Phlebotomus papatasi]